MHKKNLKPVIITSKANATFGTNKVELKKK